jgi:hypothetical protein
MHRIPSIGLDPVTGRALDLRRAGNLTPDPRSRERAGEKHPDVELDPSGHYQIAVTQPLIAPLNGQDTVLGGVEHKALSAMIDSIDDDKVRVVPHLNDTIHSDFVPEMPSAPDGKQRVRYRPLTDSDPSAGNDDGA